MDLNLLYTYIKINDIYEIAKKFFGKYVHFIGVQVSTFVNRGQKKHFYNLIRHHDVNQ
jgi:hypothetical protein